MRKEKGEIPTLERIIRALASQPVSGEAAAASASDLPPPPPESSIKDEKREEGNS